jgi:hypothetical protein
MHVNSLMNRPNRGGRGGIMALFLHVKSFLVDLQLFGHILCFTFDIQKTHSYEFWVSHATMVIFFTKFATLSQ